MVDSFFSESWYRIAGLKPRLRSHAQIHRHAYRGRDWYVLEDHASGKFYRFSAEAYHVIGLMDGALTLDRIWSQACGSLGDDMPTQEEVIQLLFQLHQANVLQTDMPPDVADMHRRQIQERRKKLFGQLLSPFAIRFPIFDPDRYLSATHFLARLLFSWPGLCIWGLAVVSGLILAGIHWSELTQNAADRILAMENLFFIGLVYPVIKTFHEFGHAYAVKRWGGEVHEMGVMLLVFMPIPYVDATSSSAFREKYKRILVGAAGIMVELFFAALAMWVWAGVGPGALRALAFNVMVIAGFSTLLFNGNPLLRFDAYYILSDYLEIPNLGTRANSYVGYLVKRYLVRLEDVRSPASAPGETFWLGLYGIASFVYRIFIMVRIALFVAGKFFFAGIVLVLWGSVSMLVVPLYRVLKYAFTDAALLEKRRRMMAICAIAAGSILLPLLLVPVPLHTVAEGVLWAPEKSRIYVQSDGFVANVVAPSGQRVKQGDLLVRCRNPELDAEAAELEARLREYDYRHRLSVTQNRIEAEILADEILRIKAELEKKHSEKADLLIRSPYDGVFLLPEADDLPDRFVRRGMPLGYVIDFSRVTARVVVPQQSVDQVRLNTRRVAARLAQSVDENVPARINRVVPAASDDLPSLALSLEGGGTLALNPMERNTPKAFETLFHFEILLPGVDVQTIGERVFVRFEHDPEPVAYRLYRTLRRTLLRKFSV